MSALLRANKSVVYRQRHHPRRGCGTRGNNVIPCNQWHPQGPCCSPLLSTFYISITLSVNDMSEYHCCVDFNYTIPMMLLRICSLPLCTVTVRVLSHSVCVCVSMYVYASMLENSRARIRKNHFRFRFGNPKLPMGNYFLILSAAITILSFPPATFCRTFCRDTTVSYQVIFVEQSVYIMFYVYHLLHIL